MSLLDNIRKLAEQAVEYSDPLKGQRIPLSGRLLFNENLFLPREYYETLLREVASNLDQAFRLYPSTSYKEEVTEKLCKVYNLEPSNVTLVAGADEGIKLALELALLCGTSKSILVVRPCYSMPIVYARNMLLTVHTVLIQRDTLNIPLRDIETIYRREKPDLIYICSPNNPLGIAHSIKEVKELVELAQDSLVLIDETYVDYADVDLAQLVKDFDNVIIVRSLSKSWGLAGLRIGYVISSQEVTKIIRGLAQPFNVSSLSLIVLDKALSMANLVRKYIEEVKSVREYLRMKLKELPHVKEVFPSSTNFVTFSLPSSEHASMVHTKLKKLGFHIRRITEPQYDDCLRVTVAPREVVSEFIHILRKILEEL